MSIVTDNELNASSSIDRVGARSNTCCPIGLCLSGFNLSSFPFSALAGEYLPPLYVGHVCRAMGRVYVGGCDSVCRCWMGRVYVGYVCRCICDGVVGG